MRPTRALAGACAALLLALGAAAHGAGESGSRAAGYAALLPGGTQGAVAASDAGPRQRSASVAGLRPTGGGSVGAIEISVGAAPGRAEGQIAVSGLRLLDGRVSIADIRVSATAAADGGPTGLTRAEIGGVTVDGVAVSAGAGSRIEVAGIGTLVLVEQARDGAGGLRVNALRLEVTDPDAATLIGEPFVIGHVALQAVPPAPEPEAATAPDPAPEAPLTTIPKGPDEPPLPGPESSTAPAPPAAPIGPAAALGLPRRPAPAAPVVATDGYAFPLVGERVSFVDDYGAPRAVTGWHHGNDLFAPTGTPILAVADGTLSRVGVNTLGGNRLWLTDDRGNEFYYAHLSAYAPAAVTGARVSAGQVIGFVGNTGQAITTPPHLHFEIHPGGRDSVNPYPYLVAWQRGAEIPRAFLQAATSPSPAPAAGAVLVDGVPELDRPSTPDDGLATPAT